MNNAFNSVTLGPLGPACASLIRYDVPEDRSTGARGSACCWMPQHYYVCTQAIAGDRYAQAIAGDLYAWAVARDLCAQAIGGELYAQATAEPEQFVLGAAVLTEPTTQSVAEHQLVVGGPAIEPHQLGVVQQRPVWYQGHPRRVRPVQQRVELRGGRTADHLREFRRRLAGHLDPGRG